MARDVIFALMLLISALVLCSSQRRRFNFNFKTRAPRYRIRIDAAGGVRARRNFQVGGTIRGEYDLYRGRGGARVAISGGVSRGVARIDGKTYKSKPHREVGIRFEVPFGRGR